MKVKMINSLGTEMWVKEDKVERYLAKGHKLPKVEKSKAAEPEVISETQKTTGKSAKKTRRR